MIQTGWMSTSTSAPFDCPIVVVSPCDFERLGLLFFHVFLKGYVSRGGINMSSLSVWAGRDEVVFRPPSLLTLHWTADEGTFTSAACGFG